MRRQPASRASSSPAAPSSPAARPSPLPANIPAGCSPRPVCIRITPSNSGPTRLRSSWKSRHTRKWWPPASAVWTISAISRPRPEQRRAFERQLSLATALGKPVFLHQRDAHADFLAIVREYCGRSRRRRGALLYGKSGPRWTITSSSASTSASRAGSATNAVATALRSAVADLPLDRVMLETDAPYLLPRNLGGKPSSRRNEPACLPLVLDMTARCMRCRADDARRRLDCETPSAVRFALSAGLAGGFLAQLRPGSGQLLLRWRIGSAARRGQVG